MSPVFGKLHRRDPQETVVVGFDAVGQVRVRGPHPRGDMIIASCHCQAVRVEVPEPPAMVSDCNCSICRRYGVLWAYYPASSVHVDAAPGATEGYGWARKALRFVRCATCGCVTHWARLVPVDGAKMDVNARLFEPGVLQGVPVEWLDGAAD